MVPDLSHNHPTKGSSWTSSRDMNLTRGTLRWLPILRFFSYPQILLKVQKYAFDLEVLWASVCSCTEEPQGLGSSQSPGSSGGLAETRTRRLSGSFIIPWGPGSVCLGWETILEPLTWHPGLQSMSHKDQTEIKQLPPKLVAQPLGLPQEEQGHTPAADDSEFHGDRGEGRSKGSHFTMRIHFSHSFEGLWAISTFSIDASCKCI